MAAKANNQAPKGSKHHLDQTDATRWHGNPDTPGQGRRSNPGRPEAGVGHTRGHNRPGRNTGGRGRDAL